MFAIPFHEYSISQIFWGFMLPDNTVYLLPCPWIVSSKSGSLKMKTSSLSTKRQETIWKKMKICKFRICIWMIHKLDLKQEDQWFCIAHLSAEDIFKSAVIEEKKFKHSLRVGGRRPISANFFYVNRKASSLWSFVASLKRITSTSDFIHIFSRFNKCVQPQVRGRQPQGTKFWCQQKPLVTSVICYKL